MNVSATLYIISTYIFYLIHLVFIIIGVNTYKFYLYTKVELKNVVQLL